jgi:tRNA dimethylallyltransferase
MLALPPQDRRRPPLLAIVGPTAVGKTAFSIRLARSLGGEIVSADSRLFYRGMDIGTDKPTLADRQAVPHHMLDVRDPDETLTLGAYQRLAFNIIDQIHARARLPILVGGTGQYVKAVLEGWGIPAVAPHESLRDVLSRFDGDELARWLQLLDKRAALAIDPRNTRRMVRALEVTLLAGRPISSLQQKNPPPLNVKVIGLTCSREKLYRRTDQRVDRMMAAGLLGEVEDLLARGFGPELPAMSGLGYKQLCALLSGSLSLPDAVARIKFETHRFVRQQHAWFRINDPGIAWFSVDLEGWEARAEDSVRQWLAEGQA